MLLLQFAKRRDLVKRFKSFRSVYLFLMWCFEWMQWGGRVNARALSAQVQEPLLTCLSAKWYSNANLRFVFSLPCKLFTSRKCCLQNDNLTFPLKVNTIWYFVLAPCCLRWTSYNNTQLLTVSLHIYSTNKKMKRGVFS